MTAAHDVAQIAEILRVAGPAVADPGLDPSLK